MARFCGKCGSMLNVQTGKCPVCDKEAKIEIPAEVNNTVLSPQPIADKNSKKDTPKANKAKKAKSKHIVIRLVALLLCMVFLVSAILGVLVYFNIANIPVMAKLMDFVGISNEKTVYAGQASDQCYTPNEENIIYESDDQSYGYVNNMVLVFFASYATESQISETVNSVNGTIVGKIEGINQYQIQVAPTDKEELEDICLELIKYSWVKNAIVDYVVTTSIDETPNDPWKDVFQGATGVDWNESDPSGTNWWFEATRITSAWEYSKYFSNIKVGIVDNGYDTQHPDLNITVLNNDVNNSENHGTHVAGVIGATVNNNKGISGILKDVSLYGVDCYATTKQKNKNISLSSLYDGINLCVQNDCKVINMSSGVKYKDKDETKKLSYERSKYAANCLVYLLDSYGKDFIVVQSAGNGDELARGVNAKDYNGWFSGIDEELIQELFDEYRQKGVTTENQITVQDVMDSFMVVAAVDKKQNKGEYQLSSFSNYGDTITVCAPGVDVFSTIKSGGLDGSYGYMDGTSMAAPIVSGVAALVWSVDQEMTSGDVKKILVDTATQKVLSRRKNDNGTYYMVDAEAAVKSAVDKFRENSNQSADSFGEPARTTSDERDIVLVLDTSGSMDGTPMSETKKASEKFINTVLKEDASIGVVTYDDQSMRVSDFCMNEDYLMNVVQNLNPGGNTNIEAGLKQAQDMLEESNAKKKIIVMMSDGVPNRGKTGDALVEYADELKEEGIYIYTLGFFNKVYDKNEPQELLEKMASDGCHFEVDDADNLVYFFGDIADQINGTKYIYVRIACPVDVTVKYDGEKLCSVDSKLSTRTSFGTLTFEENENEANNGGDNRIKILRLKEGTEYDIEIEGNGRGHMDYTIGFMDENGEYSDLRRFNNIKITKRTEINTVAEKSKSTILNVDEDGDGKYDYKYKATENGRGELVDNSYILYIVLGGVILIVILVGFILIRKRIKSKNKN